MSNGLGVVNVMVSRFGLKYLTSSRFIIFLLLVVLAYSFLRGVNFPNVWSYTHYLFPCTDFFAKRTAVGCVVETLGGKWWSSYEAFTLISLALLVALFLVWAGLISKALSRAGVWAGAGLLVFCSGVAPVFLANMPGYFDFLGVWVVLLCFSLGSFRAKLIVTFLGFFTLVLAHEAIVIIFFPLAFIMLLLTAITEAAELRRQRLFLLGGLSGLLLVVTLMVADSNMDPEVAKGLIERARQKSSTIIQPGAFDIFGRSISDNRDLLKWWVSLVSNGSSFWSGFLSYILNFVAGALFIALLNFYMLRRLTQSTLLSVLCALAPLSALALMMVAYDIVRWAAWATACSFMLFAWLCIRGEGEALRGRLSMLLIAVIIVAYQPFVSIPLLVPREDRPVIVAVYEYISDVLENRQHFPPSKPSY